MLSDEAFAEIQTEWQQTIRRTRAFIEPDPFKLPDSAQDQSYERSALELAEAVADVLQVPLIELLGMGKTKPLYRKRMMLYRALNEALPIMSVYRMSLVVNKDHATIMNGLRRAQEHYDTDPEFRREYDGLMARLA